MNACAAGTPVHTREGLRPIESVRPGDLVLTQPEGGWPGDEPVYRPVVRTFVTHPDELLHVRYRLDDGREAELAATATHPFHVPGQSKFVPAGELSLGDKLTLAAGRAVVVAPRRELAAAGGEFSTYNFEVADCHTYFVGEAAVWVHNTGDVCKRLAAAYVKAEGEANGSAEVAIRVLQEKAAEIAKAENISAKEMAKHLDDAVKELQVQGKLPKDFSLAPAAPGVRRLQLKTVDEQAKFLAENVPGLTQEQAKLLLTEAQSRNSSVVIGRGSRVRGNHGRASNV